MTFDLDRHVRYHRVRTVFLCVTFLLTIAATIATLAGWHGLLYDPNEKQGLVAWLMDGDKLFWILGIVAIGQYAIRNAMGRQLLKQQAHPREYPELYAMLDDLSRKAGLKRRPRLCVVSGRQANAFAFGLSERLGAVVLNHGILYRLTPEQIHAVMAHEMTHLTNRDSKLFAVLDTLLGVLGFQAKITSLLLTFTLVLMFISNTPWTDLTFIVGAMVILGVGRLIAAMQRNVISQSREYLADAGAIRLLGNGGQLALALHHIGLVHGDILTRNQRGGLLDFILHCLRTHPPTRKRMFVLLGGQEPYFGMF
ncbi:MAG: M48 family metalloprotease [Proteobacteria bacterium]|nr:M48 family metalloprotease [Pseudomonadota bacterium]